MQTEPRTSNLYSTIPCDRDTQSLIRQMDRKRNFMSKFTQVAKTRFLHEMVQESHSVATRHLETKLQLKEIKRQKLDPPLPQFPLMLKT